MATKKKSSLVDELIVGAKRAAKRLTPDQKKNFGKKLGEKIGRKIGEAIGLSKPKAEKASGKARSISNSKLSAPGRKLGHGGLGVPKTLTDEQRRQRADQMRANQMFRW